MPKASRNTGKRQTQASTSNTSAQMMNASFERKQKYKDLLNQGVLLNERVENNDCQNTLEQVKNLIEVSNEVSKEVNESTGPNSGPALSNASENVLDATVMKIGHEIVGVVANKLGQNEFAENVYSEKILSTIREGNVIHWKLFAEKILHIHKRLNFSQPMRGAFDDTSEAVVKEKKERAVRPKAVLGEMKRPEKVQNLQKEEKGAQTLDHIRVQIEREFARRNYTPIPYYQLILDPEDFMHTIDNAFQLAFLVRDGNIGLDLGEDEEPYIFVPSKEEKELKRHSKQTTQAVVGLNYGKWMEMKRAFGHSEPILKLSRDEYVPQSQNVTQKMDH